MKTWIWRAAQINGFDVGFMKSNGGFDRRANAQYESDAEHIAQACNYYERAKNNETPSGGSTTKKSNLHG